MGMNYYAFGPHESVDEGEGDGLHIGKKSAGWRFSFRAHPQFHLTSLESWVGYLSRPDVEIADEYGSEIPLGEMIFMMTQTHDTPHGKLLDHSDHLDNKSRYQNNGFDFCTSYFC